MSPTSAVPVERGRPRRRQGILLPDRGYDTQPHRCEFHARGIRPLIAKRNTAHGFGLGGQRWVVERTLAWLHRYPSSGRRRLLG